MNIDWVSSIGIFGGSLIVLGSMWRDQKVKNPRKLVKNWLFALGGFVLFFYAIFNYLYGTGTLFFAILEILSILASVLMLSEIKEKISTKIIAIFSLGLIIWSIFLAKNYQAVIFILGLFSLSWGYVLPSATVKRNFLLAVGGILIAVFSYLETAWIFFWLNVLAAIFSFFYTWKSWRK